MGWDGLTDRMTTDQQSIRCWPNPHRNPQSHSNNNQEPSIETRRDADQFTHPRSSSAHSIHVHHQLLNRSTKSNICNPTIDPILTTTIHRSNRSQLITQSNEPPQQLKPAHPSHPPFSPIPSSSEPNDHRIMPSNLSLRPKRSSSTTSPSIKPLERPTDPPRDPSPTHPSKLPPQNDSSSDSGDPIPSSSPSASHHSSQSSSWSSWWFTVASSPTDLNSSQSPWADQQPIGTQPAIGSIERTASIDPIQPSQDQEAATYLTRFNTWAYSWIAPSSSTSSHEPLPSAHQPDQSERPASTTIINSLPNPVIGSISTDRRGWAGYFSSRKSLPIHKLPEDGDTSVESMSIELSSSGSNRSTKPSNLNTTSKSDHASKSKSSADDPLPTNPTHSDKLRVLKGKRAIPNWVLPTFEDTFFRPPRSFIPKLSKLARTLELVQAYVFSAPSISDPQPSTLKDGQLPPHPRPHDHHSIKKSGQIADILHRNRHISTRMPKSLDLVGTNRIERLKNVNKVAIVGIHGWFPGPWLESVLGKPTGTSTKFASMMDESIRRYIAKELGGEPDQLNEEFTTLIVLEAEGRVDDRVDRLFKELIKRTDWVQSIKSADVIFFVSHSQGCLVSCKLIERLIHTFELSGHHILSLAMCGIWNGPYIGLNYNYALQPVLKFFEGPAAHELFEFQDPRSPESEAVLKSLKNCLRLGVKYVMIGSMNDQVVPLYSSINHIIDHPSILRAVFIDSSVLSYSKDFLTNLVVFCLKLRNAGLTDHGLIYSLSDYLIGSLTGVGHSTLYEDRDVFDLAARYFFETTSTLESPTYEARKQDQKANRTSHPTSKSEPHHWKEGVIARKRSLSADLASVDRSFNPKDKMNPFLLTWCLRGIIEDHKIKLLFNDDLKDLKQSFIDWNPTSSAPSGSKNSSSNPNPNSKILKELKAKLEPLNLIRPTSDLSILNSSSDRLDRRFRDSSFDGGGPSKL